MKGAVAAGHPETAKVAEQILKQGGNAFDAVIAAQMAAFVAEPVLTSPGGGGFLIAEKNSGKQIVYDFFVHTPREKRPASELDFYPIFADFGEVHQEYHVGPGSVATPGMVKGLFAIHRDLCTLPFNVLAEPAIQLARSGVRMNSFQSGVFDIIKPIYLESPEANKIFGSSSHPGKLVRENELLKLPGMADFLEMLVRDGEHAFYEGDLASEISRICCESGGHLSRQDLQNYQVIKRTPLTFSYRADQISINPPPSSGGILIGFALRLLETIRRRPGAFGSAETLGLLANIQKMTDKARIESLAHADQTETYEGILDDDFLKRFGNEISGRSEANRGTTHISVADSDGNVAGLTSSNGEGSSVMIPGTGVMLNNMLGEEDLNPSGFHSWTPGQRVSSMMAPGILKKRNGEKIVFGSGGSNRIRTAILQLLLNLTDHNMPLREATDAPRIHLEKNILNLEAGFDSDAISKLITDYPDHKIWKKKSLYFGGTHSVCSGPDGYSGAGDSRRGGVSILCNI
ncbi:gamma-glutamyltransferase [Rhodohalobacter sp. SW132]|nr:gamma-glutamyltransferase [Rhodohalobacter sp. SW132]